MSGESTESKDQATEDLKPAKLAVTIALNCVVLALAVIAIVQSGFTPFNDLAMAASLALLVLSGRQIYLGTAVAAGGLVVASLALAVLAGLLLGIYIVGFGPMSYHAGWFIPTVPAGACGTVPGQPSLFSLDGTPLSWIVTAITHPSYAAHNAGCNGTAIARFGLAYWVCYGWNSANRPKKKAD